MGGNGYTYIPLRLDARKPMLTKIDELESKVSRVYVDPLLSPFYRSYSYEGGLEALLVRLCRYKQEPPCMPFMGVS